MEAKHTHGPWYYGEWLDRKFVITDGFPQKFIPKGTNLIGTVYPISPGNHHEANARLIAAAPDLLAALDLAQQELDYAAAELADRGNEQAAENAAQRAIEGRAAIAKAKGLMQ